MITTRGQHKHHLERMSGVTPSKVIVTLLARSALILAILIQLLSAAGTPLGEESSGHLSPGTSDIIIMQSRD